MQSNAMFVFFFLYAKFVSEVFDTWAVKCGNCKYCLILAAAVYFSKDDILAVIFSCDLLSSWRTIFTREK